MALVSSSSSRERFRSSVWVRVRLVEPYWYVEPLPSTSRCSVRSSPSTHVQSRSLMYFRLTSWLFSIFGRFIISIFGSQYKKTCDSKLIKLISKYIKSVRRTLYWVFTKTIFERYGHNLFTTCPQVFCGNKRCKNGIVRKTGRFIIHIQLRGQWRSETFGRPVRMSIFRPTKITQQFQYALGFGTPIRYSMP